jgi:ATP adenylyltransferase
MQVAWAPWRMSYIERGNPKQCIFCLDGDGSRRDLVLVAGSSGVVMLNMFPYNNGHLLVAPRQHAASLAELADHAYGALMQMVRASVDIVGRVLAPQGMNVGINLGAAAGAGIVDHLHWHIVPRWDGDTNYMPVIAEVKVLPQHLQDSYDRLRPHFDDWVAKSNAETA